MATVLVIGTMDTKGPESAYLAARIRELGCQTLILDSGILGEPRQIECDIPRRQVADASGMPLDAIRDSGSRGKAVEQMLKGVRAITVELHAQGKIDGVITLGGAEGSVLAAAAMHALPLGFPKIIVSPIASGRRIFEPFMGTKDVTVIHSVVDILGLNPISRGVFDMAAAGIAGMARAHFAAKSAKQNTFARRQLAATMLGNTTKALMPIKERLEQIGFEVLIFHANGVGGPAMEEQIDQGVIHGVIDFTLSEIIGGIAGGHLSCGPQRLDAAARRGIPQLIVPGCVDFLGFGPKNEIPDKYRGRPTHNHNPQFTLVRASRDEQLECARRIAEKLNAALGPVTLIVPTEGLSVANRRHGGEFWDPETDQLFRDQLRKSLKKEIEYSEVEAHINDEAFSNAVFEKARLVFAHS